MSLARVTDPQTFIERHTQILSPPFAPELRLHLAPSVMALWEAMEEAKGSEIPPPFWAACWPGGQALSRLVFDRPELVVGKRVLDFATGCGASAIACMLVGARTVSASEIDPLAVEAARLNARLNGVDIDVACVDVIGTDAGWDVVLAGDVCYERPMAARILAWLRTLALRGALVLMADPGRTYAPKGGLEELSRMRVPVSRDLEDRDERETSIWRILPDTPPTP